MGKAAQEMVQRKFRNNTRVDPQSLTHFLCYYCGKSMNERLEYQLHMLKVHEVMSQSYQLWSDHTMDSLGLRWSGSKGHDDRETSCSLPASPISREVWLKNSEDDDEDYVYEDDKSGKKRKKEEEKLKKLSIERQRRQEDQQRKLMELTSEKMRKAEEKRHEKIMRDEEKKKMNEEKKAQKEIQKERKSMEPEGRKEHHGENRKRRKTEGSTTGGWKWKGVDHDEDPDVAAIVSKIMVESKKKEASSQDVEEEAITSETKDRRPLDYSARATKYCKVCKKGTHYTFASLFEHYQDHHHAVLKSFHYFGYNGRKLIGQKIVVERSHCQRCVMQFVRPRDYFTHMIKHHLNESVRCQLDFETADNADVEARMMFRDRVITLGYNFRFNEDPNDDYAPMATSRPGTSASTAFTDDSFADSLDVVGTPSTSEVQTIKEEPMEITVKEEPL